MLVPFLGQEDSPGKGHDNTLKYSCLGNPVDRGAWQATVHGVAKSWTQLSMCVHTLVSLNTFVSLVLMRLWIRQLGQRGMILYILTVEVQLGLRFSVPSCKVTISVFQALGSTGDIFSSIQALLGVGYLLIGAEEIIL